MIGRRRLVRRSGDGYVIALGSDESELVRRLIRELREMPTDGSDTPEVASLTARLFPEAHPDDPEAEAEYQRLMRDELVQSKLATFEIVDDALTSGRTLSDGELVAVMQSVNSIRLVLGVMLDVTDDADEPEVATGFENSPEYALYGYLSFLLDSLVTVADDPA